MTITLRDRVATEIAWWHLHGGDIGTSAKKIIDMCSAVCADERRRLRKGAKGRVFEAISEAAAKDANYIWTELAKAAVAAVFGETP